MRDIKKAGHSPHKDIQPTRTLISKILDLPSARRIDHFGIQGQATVDRLSDSPVYNLKCAYSVAIIPIAVMFARQHSPIS